MKILGISGSPRRDGNAESLLDEALRGAKDSGADTEKIILNELSMRPCQECGGCDRTGVCVVKDDMQSVYAKIDGADAVILASPIFFGSLSAQTKMMIDRFQCKWMGKYRLKQKREKKILGALILTEASKRKEFFDNAKSIVKNAFVTLDIEYKVELFCDGLETKGEVRERRECMEKARELGKIMASQN